MGEWALRDWFDKHTREEVWMVCRAGHLWLTELPGYSDFALKERSHDYFVRKARERIQRVRRCPQCQLLKQINRYHRGVSKVCPDYRGLITEARLLDGGTIEHHHPEQVAQVYSEDNVKEWAAMLALVSLQMSWSERTARKHGL